MLDLVSIFLATKLHIVVILIALVAIAFASDFQRLRTLVLASIALPLVFLTSRIASLFFENPRPFQSLPAAPPGSVLRGTLPDHPPSGIREAIPENRRRGDESYHRRLRFALVAV